MRIGTSASYFCVKLLRSQRIGYKLWISSKSNTVYFGCDSKYLKGYLLATLNGVEREQNQIYISEIFFSFGIGFLWYHPETHKLDMLIVLKQEVFLSVDSISFSVDSRWFDDESSVDKLQITTNKSSSGRRGLANLCICKCLILNPIDSAKWPEWKRNMSGKKHSSIHSHRFFDILFFT